MGSAEERRAAARERRARAVAESKDRTSQGPSAEIVERGESASPPALTVGEHEVMTMLAYGATGSEIAEALYISAEAVRSRTRTARMKLGAKTRSHAIALAVYSGLIDMERPVANRGEPRRHH